MSKKIKSPKKPNKRNNKMTYSDFKKLLAGLTDEEINQVCDWLSNQQQKH